MYLIIIFSSFHIYIAVFTDGFREVVFNQELILTIVVTQNLIPFEKSYPYQQQHSFKERP